MEILKEFFSSKYFSSFGYIVAIFYFPALVIFAGYTGQLRTSERRSFRCPSSPDSRDDCLVEYDEQFNSPFPLYGFVLLCFVPPLVVCIAYSRCFVKSRVDELEAALKPDPENPRPRRRLTKTRRVFYAYIVHLSVRLVLGILFTLLQNFVFYPDGFPTEFVCISPTVNPTVNSSVLNVTKVDDSAIDCDNSVGSDFAFCARGIWIVNILFASLVLVELLYISVQGKRNEQFTFDSEFCQRHFFSKRRTPFTLQESTFRMKRRIRENTEILEPLIVNEPECNKAFDKIFVDLVIFTGRAEHEFGDLSERHEIFEIYWKPPCGAEHIKTLDELFLPSKDTQNPRKILIVGRPGIGKSVLCTKLLRDWSKGDLLRDSSKSFEHMFLFQFRWFNTETTEKISLKQLISRLYPEESIDNEVFQCMLDNPEKVLVVFDGLDEFKHHKSCLEDEQTQGGNSPTEAMPFSALYVKLIKGKQLCGATVVTTCRPNVEQSTARLQFDRKVEIMGFTPEKIEEYVHKHCTMAIVNRIWGHISSNLELLSLCYIPANSFIVCSFLEKLIKLQGHDSGSSLPTTSTEIYQGALRLFIFKHHPEYRGKPLTKDCLLGDVDFTDSVEKTLSQVGALAKTGIEKRQLVFDSTEVHGMQDCGLFNQMQDIPVSSFRYKAQYCFIHLTLQEFLAAREIVKMDPSDIGDFITLNASDPKWHMVIQFVAGLLRDKKNEAVNSLINLLCDSLTEGRQWERVSSSGFVLERNPKILLLIKCLYEYNNVTALEKAASELQKNSEFRNKLNLCHCEVTPVDCMAIAFFIKHLHVLTKLDLSGNRHITDQGVSLLGDALKSESCKITKLKLGDINITEQGVAHLCIALKDENCKLTKLELSSSNLKEQDLSLLSDALKDENCKLTELNLRMNVCTKDQGVLHLSDALSDVNCKLTKLNLSQNDIAHEGVSHLCEALKDENCKLTKLDLSINRTTDQGLSHLSDALNDVNCKLTKLNLSQNDIADEGVLHLCDALNDENCKLTELDLSWNHITDEGVSHLCHLLKSKNCKLTKLGLLGSNLTDQGVLHLSEALKDENCKLTKLDLSHNQITDQGLSHLSDALKDENCKLSKLNLNFNQIKDQDLSHLPDALNDENCKLTKLSLNYNHIADESVSHLCDSLKSKNCKLTKLSLTGNKVTDQSVLQLCDALKDENCKLTKLDLSFNQITEQGLSHLCDALKDENCKLTKLDLSRNQITDQGLSHLSDALKDENCKVTKLDLGRKRIADQSLSHLSDALKGESCKLTKLQIYCNSITEQG